MPASVRHSARGSWVVSARLWVRPSEPRSWVWVRSGSFLLTPLLLRAGLSLEVHSCSWVQEVQYPSLELELELSGANQDANGEDTPV
jgi:hypothetical protein